MHSQENYNVLNAIISFHKYLYLHTNIHVHTEQEKDRKLYKRKKL